MRRNIKMLKLICKQIAKEPLRFDMWDFLETEDRYTPCGTTACIGGYAVMLEAMKRNKWNWKTAGKQFEAEGSNGIANQAMKILGLNFDQAERLFYSSNWPSPFDEQYEALEDMPLGKRRRRAEAKIAIARIKHFIKTGE